MINGANSTYQTGDILNGQAGKTNNTLNLTVADATTAQVAELNNVQVVNIRNVDAANAFTLNAGLWDGTTQIWNSRSIANADVEVTDVAAATAVGVRNSTAAMTVTYAEGALASKTATQTIAVEGAKATITVNAQANGGTSTDAFTGVAIVASGSASEITVGLNNEEGATVAALKSMTVSGTGELTVAFTASEGNTITTIDASANSGGVTYDASGATALKTLTGSSGDDVFTIGALAASGSVSLGKGNDQLLDGGGGALASTVTVDGGEGVDTISATLLSAANAKNIRNFEILDIAGAGGTIDASLFTASTFESLQLSAATAADISVTKLAGTSLVLNVNNESALTQAGAITATLATSSGTSDTATINFEGEDDATIASFITTGVETVNIVSGGDEDVVNELTLLTLNDNSTTSIVITGAEDFTLGGVLTNATATLTAAQASALTLIDGSSATGDLTITAGATHTVSGQNVTYNSLTINTGSGDDVITIGGRGAVNTGTGADTVNVEVLGVAVTVAADNKVDTVNVNASDTSFTASTRTTSITGFGDDDVIDVTGAIGGTTDTTVNDFTAGALATGSLVDAVNAAVSDATSEFDFFNWTDGNTYLVADNGTDITVVVLTGEYTDFTMTTSGIFVIG